MIRVVVDASVARSAGIGSPSSGPPSPACVAALDAIHRGAFRVASNQKIKEEWQRHARPYATKWLSNMIATKRFVAINEPWPDELRLIDAASGLPGNVPDEVAKDLHMVGLAMLTDRRVVSLDLRQRDLLRQLVADCPAIAALHWASPAEDLTLLWIEAGTPEEPRVQVGPVAP